MKTIKCVFLFTLFLFYACSSEKMPIYEKIGDEITLQVAKKLMSENQNLHLTGIGGGMIDDVKTMMIAFNYYCDSIEMEKGRKLLVECVETFLNAINTNEEIRPYLHNYPFLPNNVEVKIFCYKLDHHDFPPGTIFIFSELDGKVRYKSNDTTDRLQLVCEEPYEEALRIVKGS